MKFSTSIQSQASLLAVFIIGLGAVMAHAERPIRGTYQVPVREDLQQFANYPVKYKMDAYQQSPSEMTFPLPTALTGEPVMISMTKEPDQSNQWIGPQVSGNCEQIDRSMKCMVKFNDLQIDPVKAEAAIRAQFKESEIAGRLQVALKFMSEPIGILTYKLRGQGF